MTLPAPRLPDRPRGVRKHWRKVTPDLAELGEILRGKPFIQPHWGDPVEAQEFSYRSQLKRIEALYANGWHVSLSLHTSGYWTYRVRALK